MPNKTLVPDKLQGYLLQVKHMLFELISVDDRIVYAYEFAESKAAARQAVADSPVSRLKKKAQ